MSGPGQRIPTRIPIQRVSDWADNDTLAYEGSLIASGTTVLDFGTDSSGGICHGGYLINDGPGDLKFEISRDGTNYGGIHTMRPGEQLDLTRFTIKKLRLTYVANTVYRALMC